MPDLYYHRSSEGPEKLQPAAADQGSMSGQMDCANPEFTAAQAKVASWSEAEQAPQMAAGNSHCPGHCGTFAIPLQMLKQHGTMKDGK